MTTRTPQYAVRPLVPEAVYTDRQEFIDYFYHCALEAVPRRTMSTVLLGRRRMGKTEIFKRVVNRLFFEQDHTDPQAVVPVYYSFPDAAVDRETFAYEYVENLLRWYAAFRLRDVELLTKKIDREQLVDVIETKLDVTPGWEIAIELLNALPSNNVTLPFKRAIHLPRTVSDFEESTIAMFLDEFQNIHLPQYSFRINWCDMC